MSSLRWYWRVLLAVVSGVLLALAFPPVGASLLAPVAVALLVVATYRVRASLGFLLGFTQGAVCFGILLRWMALVGTDAWILLAALCAAWIGLVGLGQALVTRLRWWPLWVACVWVLEEALRDRVPWGGFTWGRLAFAQTATTLTPWASLAGAPAVTFMTALAGAALAFAAIALLLRGPEWRRWAVAGVGGLVVIGLSGLLIPRPVDGQDAQGPPTTVAAVIQGGVPNTGISASDDRQQVLDNHVAETVALAQAVQDGEVAAPDFVVWPENSVDFDVFFDAAVQQALSVSSYAVEAPLLIGSVIDAPGDPSMIANVGVVWNAETGPSDFYVKRHPVPFGEFIPLRSLIAPLVGRLDRLPRDMIAGDEPGVLHLGPARIGDVICFEIAYDEVVRDAVVAGGRVIVVQTNNATYAGLGQPEQQVAMARLRAVEHARAVVVASTTGISAIVAPDGSVVSEIPEEQTGHLVDTVVLRDSLTVADRLGAWPEWIAAVCALVAMAYAGLRYRRSRLDG